jgi:hypothetical protein
VNRNNLMKSNGLKSWSFPVEQWVKEKGKSIDAL